MLVLVVAATTLCRSVAEVTFGSKTGVGAGATIDMGDRDCCATVDGEYDVVVVRYPDAMLAKYEPVLPMAVLT